MIYLLHIPLLNEDAYDMHAYMHPRNSTMNHEHGMQLGDI
jgi:hypothetical protein